MRITTHSQILTLTALSALTLTHYTQGKLEKVWSSKLSY